MACDPAEQAVHVYDADTLEERILPGHAGRVCAVDVSPDGAWIVYGSNGGGGADLHVMRADGTASRPLMRARWWDSAPDWEPAH